MSRTTSTKLSLPVAIEKSIRAHSASVSMIPPRTGAFPTIRVSAGVRMSGQTLVARAKGIAVLASIASMWGLDVAGGYAAARS
jgi:hypothetical protein